jgi:2-methylisocitrate lyase-like PEP mutase family enzyme
VKAIVKAVAPKPVNIVGGGIPLQELQKIGVKRISMGVALYTRVMADLKKAAQQLAAGDLASASEGLSFGEIKKLISTAPR